MTIEDTIALSLDLEARMGIAAAVRHADLQETVSGECKDFEAEAVWAHVGLILRGEIQLPNRLSLLPLSLEVAA